MKVTQITKDALSARRQRRELLAVGYEEVGEGGGRLWEIYRGGRVGHKIRDVVIGKHGMSIYVRIA